jgi:hypothetical protein
MNYSSRGFLWCILAYYNSCSFKPCCWYGGNRFTCLQRLWYFLSSINKNEIFYLHRDLMSVPIKSGYPPKVAVFVPSPNDSLSPSRHLFFPSCFPELHRFIATQGLITEKVAQFRPFPSISIMLFWVGHFLSTKFSVHRSLEQKRCTDFHQHTLFIILKDLKGNMLYHRNCQEIIRVRPTF